MAVELFRSILFLWVIWYLTGVKAAGVIRNVEGLPKLTGGGYFLYEISALTEKGRYFNQSEKDFESLNPLCPCLGRVDGCSNNCCYCDLQCPVPENSFTGELMFPSTEKCSLDSLKKRDMESCGKKEKKSLFPLSCDRVEDAHDYKSRLLTLICIYKINLGSAKIFYNINPGWATMDLEDNFNLPFYNWLKESRNKMIPKGDNENLQPREDSKENINNIRFLHGKATDLMTEEVMKTDKVITVDGINFTRENDANGDVFIQVLSQPNFTIKGLAKCSTLSGGRSLENCVYLINVTKFENCSQMRNSVHITTHIVSYILSNSTTLKLLRASGETDKKIKETDSTHCEKIPDHGLIIEVRYRTTLIGSYVKFEYITSEEKVLEFPLIISYQIFYLSDQEFNNLPKFWNDFFYGKCSSHYCWRDLGKIGSVDAWRLKGLDDILLRNLVYVIVPFIPFLIYRWMEIYI